VNRRTSLTILGFCLSFISYCVNRQAICRLPQDGAVHLFHGQPFHANCWKSTSPRLCLQSPLICLCVLVAMQRKAPKGLFDGIVTEVLAASSSAATSRFDEVN